MRKLKFSDLLDSGYTPGLCNPGPRRGLRLSKTQRERAKISSSWYFPWDELCLQSAEGTNMIKGSGRRCGYISRHEEVIQTRKQGGVSEAVLGRPRGKWGAGLGSPRTRVSYDWR